VPKNNNRTTNPITDLEPASGNAPVGTEKMPGHDSPCRIHVHSLRNRLADPDGVSGKAAIDGIVHAGILSDDTAKQVKEVTYSQQKAGKGQEKTIITLTWAHVARKEG